MNLGDENIIEVGLSILINKYKVFFRTEKNHYLNVMVAFETRFLVFCLVPRLKRLENVSYF